MPLLLCVFFLCIAQWGKIRESTTWSLYHTKNYHLLHYFFLIFDYIQDLICKCMGRTKLHFLCSYGIASTVIFAQRFHIWFKKWMENPRKVISKVQFLGKRDQKIFSELTIHSIIPRKKVYHCCCRAPK